MKNRKCPYHKNCWDYGYCEVCELGQEITKLHKKIERLKKKLEKAERARGEWVDVLEHGEPYMDEEWGVVSECSLCGARMVCGKYYGFCPNCGADMSKGGKQ